jgi:hypothetical protein
MEHIEKAAGVGLERLFDYGAAMTILVIALIACGFLVRYLLNRCDLRFTESLASHKELTEKMGGIVDKNTVAFTQVVERLRDMK